MWTSCQLGLSGEELSDSIFLMLCAGGVYSYVCALVKRQDKIRVATEIGDQLYLDVKT